MIISLFDTTVRTIREKLAAAVKAAISPNLSYILSIANKALALAIGKRHAYIVAIAPENWTMAVFE
jgi:hypothetical protein